MKDKNKDEETLDDVLGDFDKIAGMKKIDTNQINQNASKIIKSKDLHELLFQGTSNMMLYLNPLGKIIKVNKAGLTFSGFSEEEVIGRMFWKLPGVFSKRNIPKYLKVFKDSLKGKPVESFISDLKDKSGNTHIMDFSTHPIREDKKISSILVIARDITEQRKIEESLHKAESKFRLIAESTSDLIATAGFDTTYTYVSPSHERIMGYSYNDLIGKRGLDFIHPDDKKMLLSLLGKYLTSKGKKIFTGKDSDVSEVFKYRVKHKSGEWRYLETTANFLGNEILLVSRDITERFQAAKKKLESSEEKYRDLAERYRLIADNVADVILQTTLPGKITYINPTCERITGFKPEEVIGKNFTKFAPKRELPRYFSKIKKMISGKKIVDFNTLIIHKDGHLVPVEFSGQKVKKGNRSYINAVMRDITKREKMEEALKESEEKYRSIFESTREGIIMASGDGKIIDINPATLELLGYESSEELVGKSTFGRYAYPEQREKLFKDLMKTGYVKNRELVFRRKDGSFVHTLGSAFIHKNKDGSIFRVVGFFSDITERKKKEDQVLIANERLKYLLSSTSAVIYTAKTSGDYGATFISENVTEMAGYKPQQFVENSSFWIDHIHPDDLKIVSVEVPKIFDKNYHTHEYRFRCRDSRYIWIRDEMKLVLDRQGKPLEIVGFWIDITEQKKTEGILKESEEKFKNLAEQSPNMIYINRKGRVVYANKVCEEIMGYSREEFYSPDFDFLTLIAPEYKDTVRQSFDMHKDGKEISPVEYALITKKGERIEAIHTTKLIQYGGENAILGIVTDITERKKTEENIRQMKDHLQNIIDSASELVLVVDKDFKISTWNKTAEIITGYKRREVIGKSLKSLNLFDDFNSVIEFLENIPKNKITPFSELILRTKTGAKRLLQVSYSSLKTETEDMKGVLIMGKDITQESEIHGKLMLGNSYIITDKTNDSAIHLFRDLAVSGHNGLFITRGAPEAIQNIIHSLENVEAIVLSQDKISRFEHVMDLDELATKIERFTATNSRPLILLDRIDYLLTNFSFDAVIKSFYRINNIIVRNKGVLLMRLNPSVINTSQLALIEEELKPLPSQKIDDIELEDYLYDALTFIHNQNQHNVLVSFKKIGQEFSISKVTTAKRLNILEEKGLIFIKKHGKSKTVHISEKGKTLLYGRKVI